MRLWPAGVAARWANPDHARSRRWFWPEDRLGALGFARSVIGIATIVAVSWGTRPPLEVVQDEWWGKSVTNIVVALGLVPVLMLLVRLANRGRDVRLRWWEVVKRVLLMAVTTFALMAPIILGVQNQHRLDELTTWAQGQSAGVKLVVGLSGLAGTLLAIAYALWVAAYVITVAVWALRTSLWSGVFHPLLAPVTAAALVVLTTGYQLIEADTKGLERGTWLVLTLGGLATTLALAAAEYSALRRGGARWRVA
ncbi:hypothetical protein ACFPM7_11905 [Actinokineospora guangxiensis]|uniref:CAAX prenyl protease-like protein n=1 Tax=Actinokineospora guangxiensis TaxID=1490288 RepID=A0ABW0ELW3_9PSEU